METDVLDQHELLRVLHAFRRGDFEARMPLHHTGLAGKVADTLNDCIELNERLRAELSRAHNEVGRNGRAGHRAELPGASGGWRDAVDAVNELVADVVRPTTEMARVIGAVGRGDLTQTVAMEVEGVPLQGEFLDVAKAVNGMVERLATFASEVTRVAREVGLEGRLGGQAQVAGVSGAWKDLTDSVNLMAANLTAQVRNIAEVTVAVASGDLSKKITIDVRGELLQLKDAINTMVDQLRVFAAEVTRVAREVGTDGKLGGQAVVLGVAGTWKDLTDSVNSMAANLTAQVRDITEVSKALTAGDLTRKVVVEVRGEMLDLKETLNTTVDRLRAFSSEVTRVAREVGTEGRLGGQAVVPDAGGTWRDLTDSVNSMAANVTNQVRNIAEIASAIAAGDLSRKLTVEARGEYLELKVTLNTMVDRLNAFASEVTRVAREVGTEGRLGGQATVEGVAGTWKGLTDNVNLMAANLTGQVRNIAEVASAIAAGDLSRKITVDAQGEILSLKQTINTMVEQLRAFSSEVTRVAREVGTEGQLGGQAIVEGVGGTWRDLTDNVNSMARNLTGQVRDIAEVAKAIAQGDLTRKITVDVRGEILELKDTINTMVDQLRAFSSEVTRVAREVGTDGRLGGQAVVPGVAGTWKDLTDSVNSMAGNLTAQVRNIAEVTTAVANGDLTRKITVDVRGEILDLKNTINRMVDQLGAFAAEVTRVAREVGTDGKLGGQALLPGAGGVWRDLTDSVNFMAANLTAQVRDIAQVMTAVALGDLTRKITVGVSGEILALKETINTMVDQLNAFASEVTRVAREVGTEGKLGGQADVRGVAGTWRELTDSVNLMASNLTDQVRNIAEVTTAVAMGDLSRSITVPARGEILKLKETVNTMVDQLNAFASEVTRVAREVGTEGRLGGQASVKGVAGTWKDLTDSVNGMAANLTDQVRNIADVTTAVANGDLTRKITVDVKGEMLELKSTVNIMVDRLNDFASEVTRVAREVGTEGRLGGQAEVRGVAGTWKDLTDNVNRMAANLTAQVRSIAQVVTAVARGDLNKKLVVEARGEIAELADTINAMTSTLELFADQVSTVAREVGFEGKLGGQARVPGAAGVWKDLTDNVNQLAGNLTSQVRAISSVATSVAAGDLTQTITVEAMGEVAELKDNVNRMISNLRETTRKNVEQDRLKTNLARMVRILQGQRDLLAVARLILKELAPLVNAQQGLFYVADGASNGSPPSARLLASYGHKERKQLSNVVTAGDGVIGQALLEGQSIILRDLPDDFVLISTGLGNARARDIVVLPVLFEGSVKAVIELASIGRFSDVDVAFLEQLTESIGIVLNNVEATTRTEELLKGSQALAAESQARQEELALTNARLEAQTAALRSSEDQLRQKQEDLKRANEQLEDRARALSTRNMEVERKNHEVEEARSELEAKAAQLEQTSRYKSQFLANMSHELRTPLTSVMLLSDVLAANDDGNLTEEQIEHARGIHSAGDALRALIEDVLDLSKVESGTVTLQLADLPLAELRDEMADAFRPIAVNRGLSYGVTLDASAPETIHTDRQRLQQILRNLLSNALKFTEHGEVALEIRGTMDWRAPNGVLTPAVAFSVRDTGIGIPSDQIDVVFEAFRQLDSGGASRKYGGTGLGLAISRELARLLGGEISVRSEVGRGSVFTLYLPHRYSGVAPTAGTTAAPPVTPGPPRPPVAQAEPDRETARVTETPLLVADDDSRLSRLVADRAARIGFRVVMATTETEVMVLARRHRVSAALLDNHLATGTGLRALERLKRDPAWRIVPVTLFSAADARLEAMEAGAWRFIDKPPTLATVEEALASMKAFVDKPRRMLVTLGGALTERGEAEELLGGNDVTVVSSSSVEEALRIAQPGASMVLVCHRDGADMVDRIRRAGVFAELWTSPATDAERAALLDRVTVELHRDESRMSEPRRRLLQRLRRASRSVAGLRVLVVDDDRRNLSAIEVVLAQQGANGVLVESGGEALRLLHAGERFDVVLMDVMMPTMDGLETTRAIRQLPGLAELPIIALTALATPADRDRCFEAGMSDFLAKPMDMDRLAILLAVWGSPPEDRRPEPSAEPPDGRDDVARG